MTLYLLLGRDLFAIIHVDMALQRPDGPRYYCVCQLCLQQYLFVIRSFDICGECSVCCLARIVCSCGRCLCSATSAGRHHLPKETLGVSAALAGRLSEGSFAAPGRRRELESSLLT